MSGPEPKVQNHCLGESLCTQEAVSATIGLDGLDGDSGIHLLPPGAAAETKLAPENTVLSSDPGEPE